MVTHSLCQTCPEEASKLLQILSFEGHQSRAQNRLLPGKRCSLFLCSTAMQGVNLSWPQQWQAAVAVSGAQWWHVLGKPDIDCVHSERLRIFTGMPACYKLRLGSDSAQSSPQFRPARTTIVRGIVHLRFRCTHTRSLTNTVEAYLFLFFFSFVCFGTHSTLDSWHCAATLSTEDERVSN